MNTHKHLTGHIPSLACSQGSREAYSGQLLSLAVAQATGQFFWRHIPWFRDAEAAERLGDAQAHAGGSRRRRRRRRGGQAREGAGAAVVGDGPLRALHTARHRALLHPPLPLLPRPLSLWYV